MGELPESVYLQTLRPVLTIVGGNRVLDTLTKQIVVNSFDQRMDYESVEFSHNFEVRRDSKPFEKYVYQGILKLSWTTKCRKFIPACILMVFDWCGSGIDSPMLESPDWKHKEATIMKYLRKFKDQCKGRVVKIAVLCLLGTTNEEVSIEEKLSSLKKSGEIDSKGLILLKHKIEDSDPLTKLKKFLYESCISHYKDEIDRLKKLKSRAHKELSGGFLELQIRYNFKLGYYCELKQERELALNFYKKCYKEIQDPSLDPAILLDEKRGVSDLVSHRIQCLLLSAPHLLVKLKEAISLFKAHMIFYKIQKAQHLPNFESHKWLSEHFSRFAGLLEKVPSEVYEKDNFWTHPGFYFQVAGIYYIMRMKLSVDDPEFNHSVQNWQAFISSSGLRIKDPLFIGQFKTLASHPLQKDMIEGISTADQVKIIKILEEAEVKHLPISLELLVKALNFYRGIIPMQKINVFILYLMSSLYKKKGDTDANYQYKCEIAHKTEGWDQIQEEVLEDLISCAESSGKVSDLLQWTLKALEIKQEGQLLLVEKLNNTLSSNLAQIKSRGMISAKCKFDSKFVAAYSSTTLSISLTSKFPCKLSPLKISLFFSDSSFNCENIETLALDPLVSTNFTHNIIIRVPSMPPLSLLSIIARYEPVGLSWIDFEINAKAKVQILSPAPQLSPTFNHLPPALIGENYMLNVKLHPYSELSDIKMMIYEEDKDASQMKRAASIDRNFDNNFCIFSESDKLIEDSICIESLKSPQTIPLKLIFYEQKSYNLKAKFSYTVTKPQDITYKWEDVYDLDINVQPPFQFKLCWSSSAENLSSAILNAKLWNVCLSPIFIYKMLIIPEPGWESVDAKNYEELEIDEGNLISEDFIGKVDNNEVPITLNGSLLVTWSRNKGVINDCRIPVPQFTTQYYPIDINVEAPSEVFLGQVFEIIIIVRNKTKFELEARLVLQEVGNFLVGGVENVKIDIKEESEKKFKIALVGLETGINELPNVSVKLQEVSRTWLGKILILP